MPERLAEAHAHALGAELILKGGTPRHVRVEIEAGGWLVTVEVAAASELPHGLTPCELDVIRVLRGRRGPLTTACILEELDRLERAHEILGHGESTVVHALPRLVRMGVLVSSRRAPRGYSLEQRYEAPAPAAEAG